MPELPVERCTAEQFAARLAHAKVLETKQGTPAVAELAQPDGPAVILKTWQRRRRSLRAKRRNPHLRFAEIAAAMRARGFTAPLVTGVGEITGTDTCWVSYQKLAGEPLRTLVARRAWSEPAGFAAWLTGLHEAGVYFRSLHLANVLLDGERFALIDLGDTQFLRRSLPYRLRVRNLGMMIAHPEDLAWMLQGFAGELIDAYARQTGLPDALGRDVMRDVQRRTARRAAIRRRRGLPPPEIGHIPAEPPGGEEHERP